MGQLPRARYAARSLRGARVGASVGCREGTGRTRLGRLAGVQLQDRSAMRADIYTAYRQGENIYGEYRAQEGCEPGLVVICADNGDLDANDIVSTMEDLND